MPTSLNSIVSATRKRVGEIRRSTDFRDWERRASEHMPRGFRSQLQRVAKIGPAIIAELKKASPSRGLIRADFEPGALARELGQAGAAALSVLTDEEFFQGSLANLEQASFAASLPCLRKDFIVDEIQILEARAYRADAILLIVAALTHKELGAFTSCAQKYGLDVLCEVHDEQELKHALDAGCDVIGVNNRDLKTFHVDSATALRLADKIPAGCVRVAESGIHSGAAVARLRAAGYDAFLVGESLMRAAHPGKALTKLREEAGFEIESMKLEARSS